MKLFTGYPLCILSLMNFSLLCSTTMNHNKNQENDCIRQHPTTQNKGIMAKLLKNYDKSTNPTSKGPIDVHAEVCLNY